MLCVCAVCVLCVCAVCVLCVCCVCVVCMCVCVCPHPSAGELVQISHSLMSNLANLTLKAGRKVHDVASMSEVGGAAECHQL